MNVTLSIFGSCLTLTPTLTYCKLNPDHRDRWLSIGLTATPYRLKSSESLGDIYEFITCAPMPRQLIEDGVLVQPIYYDVPNAGAGKIDVRITYIVDNWLKIGQDSKTIAFCPSVAFARALTQAFEAVGVRRQWCMVRHHQGKGTRYLNHSRVTTQTRS
jgi:superfamily II DNA or RNA helicase